MVTPAPNPSCDIFCRVIDNYGDIGVCWRLARQLSSEHGWQVRLWVDDLEACELLTQGVVPPEISLQPWLAPFPDTTPASVVIEAFACELPENYVQAMATMPHAPVWLNLEYLCVEDWGPGIHGQPSPHPRLPLLKHFFVPGILAGTGGLLHEAGLAARQQNFAIEAARRSYASDISGRWIFLFCYDNPALPLLLQIWAEQATPTHVLIAAGKPNAQAATWLGAPLTPGQHAQHGNLHLHALPFVAQKDFDALLWICDLAFVRGEDSFGRALWAAMPHIWQLYPQAKQDNAHHAKLEAFYRHYAAPDTAGRALTAFTELWNGVSTPTPVALARAWQALDAALPALGNHAGVWLEQLADLGDLTANLVRFCREKA